MRLTSYSEEHVLSLAQKIKPLVRQGHKVFFINAKDIITDVYFRDCTIHSQAEHLSPIMEIETTHKATLASLFRPSISEVLCQIPSQLVEQVCAFETKIDKDSFKYHESTHTHHAKTILYTGTLPEMIKHQEVLMRGTKHQYPFIKRSKISVRE